MSVEYKLQYNKKYECDIHRLETDEMTIYTYNDIAEFFKNEELFIKFGFDINMSDDYVVNGFYIAGSDLIDYMKT